MHSVRFGEAVHLSEANRWITCAWLISAVGIGLELALAFNVPVLSDLLTIQAIYLFLPWIFPGILALPLYFVVSVLTFFLYKKSRVSALLLLTVYCLSKAFEFLWLHGFSTSALLIWLLTTIVWGLGLLQGVRGTFAYYRQSSGALGKHD